jgi:prophage antirepressor-like protein
MSGIIPFDFESHAVRSVLIDGKPWFVAADVCRVLEVKNHRDAVAQLDEDERDAVGFTDAIGRQQSMIVISEGGVIWLSSRSNKPVAKRFWKWVRSEVLPALIRDGYYAMPGVSASDAEELASKRAYVETLPEGQRAQAQQKVRALEMCRALIEDGARVSHAVRAVAQEFGVSEKTVWNYRRATYMVPRPDWEAACAPQWRARPGGMMVECHPEALRFFMDLAATRARITDCYRRTVEVAAERGWHPVPGIHVLRRHAARVLSTPLRRSVSA